MKIKFSNTSPQRPFYQYRAMPTVKSFRRDKLQYIFSHIKLGEVKKKKQELPDRRSYQKLETRPKCESLRRSSWNTEHNGDATGFGR